MGEGVLTQAFARREGAAYCEDVPAERIARDAGTPTFVYSAAVIRDRFRRLSAALEGVPHRIHYSLKANSNRAILHLLRELGSGADVVSGGELFRARRAGFGAHDIIFGGVGKTAAELRDAVQAGIKLINVESEAELRLLDRIAGELGTPAPVGFRINPEVAVETRHEYIATGSKGHKFGIPFEDAAEVVRTALALPNVRVLGLDMHVGSQLASFEPYRDGLEKLAELASRARALGASLKYVDIGGGLPVAYGDGDADPDLGAWHDVIVPVVRKLGVELLVEPGRFFAAASGVLLSRVLYRKRSGGKDYVIADAGMTELLRPSHYDAYHFIETATARAERATVDVVGPVCESGDFLALDREMEDAQPGDLLVIHTAGAYGYVMSSTYNARPRAAEVMVDGHRFAVVTERERYEDLVRLEQDDPEWRDA
ncbi:MAG: diaminopimelate decarboxylase [Gemmatimonadetes bacterium]|nr:diaminopimelate decarboxylase [Gemmatimonadota bacterium]MBI3567126.1 diaminopimelate decarboxylase [Gemmatimonadota bacterium]